VSRLGRFLHIERSRADGTGTDRAPDQGTAARFGTVEAPGPAGATPAPSGAELERFGPEPAPGIDLAETDPGARPFTRCMRCGMDHGVFASECGNCGASLATAEQREFNERLWSQRREEAAREARALEERRALAAREEAELAAARRAMGEQLAREVGMRERLRLDEELGPDGVAWYALRRLLRGLLRLARRGPASPP
jgi:hypothetical protein